MITEWLNPRQSRPSKRLWPSHPHHMIAETGSHDSLRRGRRRTGALFGVLLNAGQSVRLCAGRGWKTRVGGRRSQRLTISATQHYDKHNATDS